MTGRPHRQSIGAAIQESCRWNWEAKTPIVVFDDCHYEQACGHNGAQLLRESRANLSLRLADLLSSAACTPSSVMIW